MPDYLRSDLMYRQFCKNLDNFININESPDGNYRLKIAKELKVLTNPNYYKKLMEENNTQYMYISNLIFRFQAYKQDYPSIDKFLWELWGYGFDSIKSDEMNIDSEETIYEKVKLLDLLLGTHYWN